MLYPREYIEFGIKTRVIKKAFGVYFVIHLVLLPDMAFYASAADICAGAYRDALSSAI